MKVSLSFENFKDVHSRADIDMNPTDKKSGILKTNVNLGTENA